MIWLRNQYRISANAMPEVNDSGSLECLTRRVSVQHQSKYHLFDIDAGQVTVAKNVDTTYGINIIRLYEIRR